MMKTIVILHKGAKTIVKKTVIILSGLFLLLIQNSLAQAVGDSTLREGAKIEIEVRPWVTDLEVNIKVSSGHSDGGTELDFKHDLNIGDDDFVDVRVSYQATSRSKIRLSYVQMDFDGEKTLAKTLRFGGITFAAGSRVLTGLDLGLIKLAWIRQMINKKYFQIDGMVEVKGMSIVTNLHAPSTEVNERDTSTMAVPTVGVAVNVKPFSVINVFGEVTGLYIDQDEYGYIYDAEAGIRIIPFKHVNIIGGYRVLKINLEDAPDFAKIRLEGPFMSVVVRF